MSSIELPTLPKIGNLFKPTYKHSYLRLLSAAQVLRSFVMFGVLMFIHQYLIPLLASYGCTTEQAMLVIGGLFLLLPLTHFLFLPIASKFLARAGIKSVFTASLILFGIVAWLGFRVKTIEWYPFIFMLWGIAAAMWWFTYHTFFLEIGDQKKVGRDVSIIELLMLISGVVAPILFGFVIENYGFRYMGMLNALILLLAIGVVMFMKDFESLPVISYKDIVSNAIEHPRHFLAFFAYGMNDSLSGLIWPLYLYFVFRDPLVVGLVAGGIALSSAFFIVLSGRLADSISRSKLEHFGAVVVGLSWVIRALTFHPVLIAACDIAYRSFHSFFSVPLNAHGMSIGMKTNKAVFVGFRETAVIMGNVVVLLLFIFTISIGLPFYTVFLLGIVIAALALLLRDPHSKVDPRLHTHHSLK